MSHYPQPAAWVVQRLREGLVIPAHPLALTRRRKLDERRQRGLTRYYLAAGAGGLAVGVHTTQFAIREPNHGLLRPVLELAATEARSFIPHSALRTSPLSKPHPLTPSLSPSGGEGVRRTGAGEAPRSMAGGQARRGQRASPEPVLIAGICGATAQAVREARLARELGYHAGLLSLGALRAARDNELIAHCRTVAREIPLIGFYLQPAAGGRLLPFQFWQRFVEIPNVVAVKIAAFNRYQTLDVIRAVAEAGRADAIALYTGNDDHILLDLLTEFSVPSTGGEVRLRMVGGLLGQWACWTKRAVGLLEQCKRLRTRHRVPATLLTSAEQLTDANAAIFDAAHGFAGCVPGIHEVLRHQGLLANTGCLDPRERLSPGQGREIARVCAAYPHLSDDAFVREHLDQWLSG